MHALLMEALITSCGRPDLLCKTIESFQKDQSRNVFITIQEDGLSKKGQHHSIERFLARSYDDFYLHMEEDWEFENSYDWIANSLAIMEQDPLVIKVLCRSDSPHPCKFDQLVNTYYEDSKIWGYVNPWKGQDGILWHGFSWNPGVTNAKLLRRFMPFGKWEQDVARDIYVKGYKVAMLKNGICKHIGHGRSTHE
jgi:hypothetical protein